MEYILIALILGVAAAVVVIFAKRIAAHTFRCKHCAKEFNIKWPRAVVAEHDQREYRLLCPHCKTRGWCTQQPKKQPPAR